MINFSEGLYGVFEIQQIALGDLFKGKQYIFWSFWKITIFGETQSQTNKLGKAVLVRLAEA